MKRIVSFILCLLIWFCMAGCNQAQKVSFYYPRTEIQYGISDGVIAAEARELSDSEYNLEYILKLYLEGPVSQDLHTPFPAGTALISVSIEEGQLTLTLSESFQQLENLEYTMACTCIASTCLSLTDAKSVTILSGDSMITLTQDTVSLWDESGKTFPE